jgi:putative FmdB family regulatory protein
MPTYEYACDKCGHQFEQFQSMKDSAFTVCPKEHCARKTWGRGKVKRVLGSGAGLIFKGSGFYITDYRSENYKAAAKKESSAGTTGGGEAKTGASGGDKKPATPKPESRPKASGGGKE